MAYIKRSALLPYPVDVVYALVNDVKRYPEFLPGCLSATVLSESPQELVATLELGKAGLKKKFTTRNELKAPHTMCMHLVEGPFRRFQAQWTFSALGEAACKVQYDMNFEMSAGLIDAALASLFESTAEEMVNAVCKRAEQLYGKT